jgi:hypothetical protein
MLIVALNVHHDIKIPMSRGGYVDEDIELLLEESEVGDI